ncbi:DUF1559 family PulG-like putative transporter [Lignipirellula cremea]|uniref:DUF1559 domain-containing protein n=1 Tax=Lignipirellula cremea TaxID=2528010 RepID=A0A518DNH4_9BACT|nr:DUF1559 domain-containing protein [Lignipirellula cremea]QDU93381.1 hypothetical protein Pla8534_11610 [Lignipirellula cremea]
MSIPVTCPHCRLQTQVAEVYRGKTGPCRNCGESLRVPQSPDIWRRWVFWLTAALVVMVVGYGMVVYPPRRGLPPQDRLMTSVDGDANLVRIALALRSYHRDYDRFPPAGIQENGKPPAHSWRVLLLPYLGETMLFRLYRQNEPWNSPHNLRLAAVTPDIYAGPEPALPGSTAVLAITGEDSVWNFATNWSLVNPESRMHQLPLLIRDPEASTIWTSPVDFDTHTLQQTGLPDDALPPRFIGRGAPITWIRLQASQAETVRFHRPDEWREFFQGKRWSRNGS